LKKTLKETIEESDGDEKRVLGVREQRMKWRKPLTQISTSSAGLMSSAGAWL